MSSDFAGFLQQPFVTSALGMMCFFFLLLVGTIAALVYARRRRAQKQAAAGGTSSFEMRRTPAAEADMPDLDLLIQRPAAPAAAPKPVPAAPAAVPAPVRAARKGTFTITTNDGTSTEAVEVLTVLRDVVDGKLIVQMGDKAYQNVNVNAEFRTRLQKVLRELGQETAATEPPPSGEAGPADELLETSIDAPISLSSLLDSAEMPAVTPPTTSSSAPPPPAFGGKMPGDLPSFRLEDNPMPKKRRGQKLDLQPVPEINIAAAIEAYLQHKLSYTAEFSGRSIHIYPAPDGGVSIEVDGKYYEAVGDVQDVQVREFLAQTIQEWQERH